MKKWVPALVALFWVILSLIALLASAADVKGFYPDWVEHVGQIVSRFVYVSLIVAWSIWIIWFSFGRRRQLYSWFRIGVCIAFFLSVVRVVFFS